MAHEVTFTVPERPLGRRDIEFDVKRDGVMLGTLKVSKGGIVWRQRDNQYGYRLSWAQLDAAATERGRRRAL